MIIKELVTILDTIAPFFLQENYDNSGVQFADLEGKVQRALLCLDVTGKLYKRLLKKM